MKVPSPSPGRTRLVFVLWEHLLPLALYTLFTLALTWPVAAHFTTQIPGNSNDAYNGLWVMWHVKEALFGRQPLFDLPLLYYPSGATLLTHVPGPLTGFFALPFWPWGPAAAHNGATLVSFVLTGYGLYLLARALGMTRPVAFFSGLLLLLAPMHLAGLWGHTTKVFLGAMPLVLLGLLHSLNPGRSLRWVVVTAVALLAAMLHDSLQFILLAMAMAFFIVAAFVTRPRSEWKTLLRRVAALAVACLFIVGPLLIATIAAANAPGLDLDRNFDSFTFQPDAVELLLPPAYTALFGPAVTTFFNNHNVIQHIETEIYLSWLGLILAAIAFVRVRQQAWPWLVFTLICAVLSLGPALKLLGRQEFTEYGQPLILPYAFFTALPGMEFMRTPGRFMTIGFVTFAVAAGLGLAWLVQRYPRYSTLLTAAAVLFVLLEHWPQPWPMMALRPVPTFYQQLAQDGERYGVLDLPVRPDEETAAMVYGTHYQMYQMTHGKGIALGYLSRTYYEFTHPVLPCLLPQPAELPDIMINGEPARCYQNGLYDLARFNYRYVVWHKPQPWYDDYTPGSWGEMAAAETITTLFGNQPPLLEDEWVRVYAVPPLDDVSTLTTTIALQENWYPRDVTPEWSLRWAQSPAVLTIYSPQTQTATLELTPALIYQPGLTDGYLGDSGVLLVEMENNPPIRLPIRPDETAQVALTLQPGVQTITLTLEAGSINPADLGEAEHRILSFAIHSLNLKME
jgi:hypothetical protein